MATHLSTFAEKFTYRWSVSHHSKISQKNLFSSGDCLIVTKLKNNKTLMSCSIFAIHILFGKQEWCYSISWVSVVPLGRHWKSWEETCTGRKETTAIMLQDIKHRWLLKNVKETSHSPTFSHCIEWIKIWLAMLEFHITKAVISISSSQKSRDGRRAFPLLSPFCLSPTYFIPDPSSLQIPLSQSCLRFDLWFSVCN